MADTSTLSLGSAPPPVLPRRRELLFGTAFATAGVVMALATLIGAYIATRDATGAAWLSVNNIPLTQPNMQLLTIGMSVVTMQWAVWSINRDDRYHTYLALGVTLLLGAAFVNQTSFLFNQAGITIVQAEGPLFYAVTAGHLAMVVAGMIFMALMGVRTLGGQFSSRQPDGIGAAAIFWYAAVALYVVIWFAVYVQK
jgi:heme/copper-type cytochrome/quinol oxidase subunit 3